MKQVYSLFKKILLLSGALIVLQSAIAQEITVSGKITGADDGGTLPGVSITIKDKSKGTISDFDGVYTIKTEVGSTLIYSFIGYKTAEVVVTGATQDMTLEVDNKAIEEIVIIGYGTVKKDDATGSVTAVKAEDFNRGAITSPQELIIGKTAGVVITSSNGEPGGGAQIRIRGGSSLSASNDPLIVIDGIPLDNEKIDGMSNQLSTINPNDIETFTVLKDASAAAIYGSRASNGVIIITTKRGAQGKKTAITYNGNIAVGTPVKYMENLSGDQLRALAIEKLGTNNITEASLAHLGVENTDWQKEIYQNSISHDHNISLAGTVKDIPYRASYGFTNQEGVLKNTDLKRHTLSLNMDPSFLGNSLKVKLNAKGSLAEQNFGNTDAIGSAVRFDPTKPIMNGNKRYAGYTAWTLDQNGDGIQSIDEEYNQMATANPIAQCDMQDNSSEISRFVGNIQADYIMPFLPALRASVNMGIDWSDSKGVNNADTTATWTRRAGYGRVLNYSQEKNNKIFDFTLNYNTELNAIKSRVDAMVGYSYQSFWRFEDNYDRSVETPSHPLIVNANTDLETENILVSFFGRVNYSLMDRYLITFTLRQDGSSRFSKDNRWGLFPSLAFAWKIKEESFLKDVSAISEMKLRAGWGQTGQQNIVNDNDYPYMVTYTVSEGNSYYQFDNKWYPTLRPDEYDPDIKWETTTTKNIGLDFGFLEDRITGSIDYYERETKDLINDISIPNGSNFSNHLLTNVGTLENTGYELTLNAIPVSKGDFKWEVGFTLSHNENKITKLTRTDDPSYLGVATGDISGGTGNKIQMHSVGHAASSFFVLQQIYNNNGNPIEGLYVDRSGQGGNIYGNLNNYYHCKSPAPDYLIGLSTRVNYKNFDLSASARISTGNYVYNNIAAETFYANLYNNNFWQNMSTSIYDSKFNNSQYHSDYYIQNASFFKLDNISLGYSFDKLIKEQLRGRVSFTVQNALLITDYDGVDPEVTNGIDNNIYPRPRTFLVALTLNF